MLEHAKERTPERLAIRIRPPDQAARTVPLANAEESPLSQLRMPPRETVLPRWLSVEQVRKMQRMRRETVINAMLSGELPYEQRGRIRYIRLSDVLAWEERRTRRQPEPQMLPVHPDLVQFL